MRHYGFHIAIGLLCLSVSACAQMSGGSGYDTIATGKVVTVGQHNMIVESGNDILFVNMDDVDANVRKQMQVIKKGDKITLLGVHQTSDNKAAAPEVDAVQLANGKRIQLNL